MSPFEQLAIGFDRAATGVDTGPQPTPEQRAAIEAPIDRPVMIAAGPGTGKTFTLVERAVWLVRHQAVELDRLLVVTFTEKAADEVGERLRARLSGPIGRPRPPAEAWIGTFHAIAARILRDDAYRLGRPRDFEVLDDVSQRLLWRRLGEEALAGRLPEVNSLVTRRLTVADLRRLIQAAGPFAGSLSARGITPDRFRTEALAGLAGSRAPQPEVEAEAEAVELLAALAAAYRRVMRERGLLDFDGLIDELAGLLEGSPEARADWRARFRYILIDEFQDTSARQLDLVSLLAADGFANVTAVGDLKQSIYAWRFAEPERISGRFPGTVYPLTQNRRSAQVILDAATHLIRQEPAFVGEPALIAGRQPELRHEPHLRLVIAPDPRTEAAFVAGEITRLRETGTPLDRIAVLARSVRHLPPDFEEEFRRRGIPVSSGDRESLFDTEVARDGLALLQLLDNPYHDGALTRLLQGPVVRLDDATLYKVVVAGRGQGERNRRLLDAVDGALKESGVETLDPAAAGRVRKLLHVIDRLAGDSRRAGLTVTFRRVLDQTGYLRHWTLMAMRGEPDALDRARQLAGLVSHYAEHGERSDLAGLIGFLSELAEMERLPVVAAGDATSAGVRLMTVHRAKGLEFDAVFLVDNRPASVGRDSFVAYYPQGPGFVMKTWNGSQLRRFQELKAERDLAPLLAEERRIRYVAMTRARERLYLTRSTPEARLEETGEPDPKDHVAVLADWAAGRPGARVDRLEPVPAAPLAGAGVDPVPIPDLGGVLKVARALNRPIQSPPPAPPRLSFSRLRVLDLCPQLFWLKYVAELPAPPDDLEHDLDHDLDHDSLRTAWADHQESRAGALGRALHRILEAFHDPARPARAEPRRLLEAAAAEEKLDAAQFEAARDMLGAYLDHPLARATTLAVERSFTMAVEDVVFTGKIDRLLLDRDAVVILDYKTGGSSDPATVAAHEAQLRYYHLAASRGRLGESPPGGWRPVLFDLRRGQLYEVTPDDAGAAARLAATVERSRRADYALGPEHAERPCFGCAYRRVCPQARKETGR